MSLRKIYLFGYSGHALVVEDCIDTSKYILAGYFDKEENLKNPLNIDYCGDETKVDIASIVGDGVAFPSVGSNQIRNILVSKYYETGLNQIIIQHESSYVADSAQIGLSTLIAPKAVVNAKAQVGTGVIINTAALVEHECVIGDYTHICPGTVLAGNVKIGSNVFIGANSTVKQGVSIGDNAVVGAGSVVLSDIGQNEMWAGVPAVKIKDIE